MTRQPFNALPKLSFSLMLIALSLVFSSTSYAIPAFARMYGTSCSTCARKPESHSSCSRIVVKVQSASERNSAQETR